MFNSLRETRDWTSGSLVMNLEMKESDYFFIYDHLNSEVAEDIVRQYLKFRGDDGSAKDIKIHHNPNTHIVSITGRVDYLDNDETQYEHKPDYLSYKFY